MQRSREWKSQIRSCTKAIICLLLEKKKGGGEASTANLSPLWSAWKNNGVRFLFVSVTELLMVIISIDADVHALDDDRNIILHEIATSPNEPSFRCSAGWNYVDNFYTRSKTKRLVRKAHVRLLCKWFIGLVQRERERERLSLRANKTQDMTIITGWVRWVSCSTCRGSFIPTCDYKNIGLMEIWFI